MLKDINEKINMIKEELALKTVLEGKMESIKIQLENEEKILEGLKISLKKEHKDVEKLEKISFSNLVATLMQNKDGKLQKEQHEYLMAKIKYDDQNSKVDLLKENFTSIQARLVDLKKCESGYKELLNKKIEIIKANGKHDEGIKLSELEMQIDKALRVQKEIEEAEAVGSELLSAIGAAIDSLRGAKNWGIWDIAGGDFISSIAKHSKIDEAKRYFEKISHLLRTFNKELGDVKVESISFSSTTIAFDLFFDNIFTDFSVQNKINSALDDAVSLMTRVEDILNKLGHEKEDLKMTIVNKRREYDDFIENL